MFQAATTNPGKYSLQSFYLMRGSIKPVRSMWMGTFTGRICLEVSAPCGHEAGLSLVKWNVVIRHCEHDGVNCRAENRAHSAASLGIPSIK